MSQKSKLEITARKLLLLPVLLSAFFITSNVFAYPPVKVQNNTDWDYTVLIKYIGCKNDTAKVKRRSTWTTDRGACLITAVEAFNGNRLPEAKKDYAFMAKYKPLVKRMAAAVAQGNKLEIYNIDNAMVMLPGHSSYFNGDLSPYESTGTSYSKFYINGYSRGAHKVLSEAEFKGDGTGYPVVTIKNYTRANVYGEVEYSSEFCADDTYTVRRATFDEKGKLVKPGVWKALSRGVCLVDGITADGYGANKEVPKRELLKKITPYDSTGTSYSQFGIQLYGGGYRVYGEEEFKTEQSRQNSVKSPGFKIHNRTNYPVNVSLEQAGCLYHGIINPEVDGGKPFVRNTGSIWFDVRAKLVPFGAPETSDWECIEPVAQIVFDVATTLIGNPGLATAIQNAAKAGGKMVMNAIVGEAVKDVAKASTKELIKNALKAGVRKGSTYVVEKSALIINMTKRELAEAAAEQTGTFFAKQGGKFLIANVIPNQSFEVALDKTAINKLKKLSLLDPTSDIDEYSKAMDDYTDTFNELSELQWEAAKPIREVVRRAEFSGYEWPFRCDRMPEYEITGGPEALDWTKGTPLIIRKLNTCGNDLNDNLAIDSKTDDVQTASRVEYAKRKRAEMVKIIESR